MAMRSPPTSRPIDARSSVEVITASLPCAHAADGPSSVASTASVASRPSMRRLPNDRAPASERVCTVSPDRELELEQQLVGGRSVGVVGAAVLPSHLAELT